MKNKSNLLFFSAFFFFFGTFFNLYTCQKEIASIRWGQSSYLLNIRVLISSIKEETVEFTEKDIHILATDTNGNNFEMNLNTLRDIDPAKSSYKILNNGLKLKVFKKVKEPCWKYLTTEKTNEHFIRDKALGNADDCEGEKEKWFSEYKHYIRLKNEEGSPKKSKTKGIDAIIENIQHSHPNFYVHEY